MRVLPTDPVREQGSRRDRLLLTLATAASTAAALASAILISWALQTISAGAIFGAVILGAPAVGFAAARSEEHTSELQSLMRISYAGFCWKKKTRSTEEKYERSRINNIGHGKTNTSHLNTSI